MTKILLDTEFYNTPDGDVMYKQPGQPAKLLKDSDREIITGLLQAIRDRYPQSFEALMQLYSASSRNRSWYEFRVVHRFLRCNFGEYDEYTRDVDAAGRFRFEEVRCPLRGECQFEGIICKPEIHTALSDREMEVFRLIVDRLETAEIAEQLCISPFTVIRHRDNIKARIGARSIADMIKYWYTNNLK